MELGVGRLPIQYCAPWERAQSSKAGGGALRYGMTLGRVIPLVSRMGCWEKKAISPME